MASWFSVFQNSPVLLPSVLPIQSSTMYVRSGHPNELGNWSFTDSWWSCCFLVFVLVWFGLFCFFGGGGACIYFTPDNCHAVVRVFEMGNMFWPASCYRCLLNGVNLKQIPVTVLTFFYVLSLLWVTSYAGIQHQTLVSDLQWTKHKVPSADRLEGEWAVTGYDGPSSLLRSKKSHQTLDTYYNTTWLALGHGKLEFMLNTKLKYCVCKNNRTSVCLRSTLVTPEVVCTNSVRRQTFSSVYDWGPLQFRNQFGKTQGLFFAVRFP